MSEPDPPGPVARLTTGIAITVLVVAVAIGGLWALGAATPPKRPAVTTDRLGPSGGESVSDYLAGAAAGLVRAQGTRWALISLRVPIADDAAWALTAGTGTSQVILHVTVTGVATPAAVVPLTHDRGSLRTARDLAIAKALTGAGGAGGDGDPADPTDRGARIASLVGSRLRAGDAAVVGVVVRGPVDRLRAIATAGDVRGVEVLPADAAGGRFTVTPLLPEQSDRVGPLPDTAAVPDR